MQLGTKELEVVRHHLSAVFESAPVGSKSCLTVFDAATVPLLALDSYFSRLVTGFACSPECCILAAIFLRRVSLVLRPTKTNLHRLVLGCLLLAVKSRDDTYFSSTHYAVVAGVDRAEILRIVQQLLKVLDWHLFVEFEEYVEMEDVLTARCSPPSSPSDTVSPASSCGYPSSVDTVEDASPLSASTPSAPFSVRYCSETGECDYSIDLTLLREEEECTSIPVGEGDSEEGDMTEGEDDDEEEEEVKALNRSGSSSTALVGRLGSFLSLAHFKEKQKQQTEKLLHRKPSLSEALRRCLRLS